MKFLKAIGTQDKKTIKIVERDYIKKPKGIPIYFTSGKIENWSRQKLIEHFKDRANNGHFDDIADFFIFQTQQQKQKVRDAIQKIIPASPEWNEVKFILEKELGL